LQKAGAADQDRKAFVEYRSERPVGRKLWRLIMIISVTSSKSLDELDQDFRRALQRHKFGVLNVLDLKQTLGNKGIVLERECRVYDICNPQAASTALNTDMSVSVVLPCRVSVYQDGQTLTIATVKPTDLMKATDLNGVAELATEIEREVSTMMREAA
jgi:uncharacterized protein (DUF302 family)